MEDEESCVYLAICDVPEEEEGYWPKGVGIYPDDRGPIQSTQGNDQMAQAQENLVVPSYSELVSEQLALVELFVRAGINFVFLPNASKEARRKFKLTHDREFLCDPSHTGPNGEVYTFNMGAEWRKTEALYQAEVTKVLGVETIVQQGGDPNEGGNIRWFKDPVGQVWYVGAVSKRSTHRAHVDLAKAMGVPEIRTVIVEVDDALHLDCAFMPHTDENKVVLATHLPAFTSESRGKFRQLGADLNAEILELTEKDKNNLATNRVQVGNVTLGGFVYEQMETALREAFPRMTFLEAKQKIRTFLLGGSINCLSRQYFFKEPIDIDALNKRAKASGLFGPGGLTNGEVIYFQDRVQGVAFPNFQNLALAA